MKRAPSQEATICAPSRTTGPGCTLGDVRFRPHYERIAGAADRAAALRAMSDEEIVAALAVASADERVLANVLATEAQNRMRRARAALEHLGEGVLSVNAEGQVVYTNPAAERLLGCPPGALLGLPIHGRVHPGPDEASCCVTRAIRDAVEVRCETEEFVRADGSFFPVAYVVAPILADGVVCGAVLVFDDVTERKRAEAALRESETRWHSLADAAFEGILIHDRGRILDANRACAELLGLTREQLLGRDAWEFVAPSSRPRAEAAMAEDASDPYVVTCIRPDGRSFEVEVRGRKAPYGGRLVRVVAMRPRVEPAAPGA